MRRGSPRTASGGSRSGPTSSSAERPTPSARLQSPLAGRGALTLVLAALPLAFVVVFFVFPLASILIEGLAPEGAFDLGAFVETLSEPFVIETAWFTLWQAALSTVLTVLVAMPGSYLYARFRFRGRQVLWALTIVPFVLPTVVVGAAFLALLGPRSPFGLHLEHTIWAILLAHVFYNYAVVLRIVGGFWTQLDPRLETAARMLGASPWSAFRHVTLPLLRPAIASAASIVFLFTFTSFGVVLLVGGPQFATLEVEIYRQTAQLLDLRAAATLALVQLAALCALLLVYSRYQQSAAVSARLLTGRWQGKPIRTGAERVFMALNLALVGALLGLPLLVMVERSLAGEGGYSLANYASLFDESARGALFVPPIEAVSNSLMFAVAAAAACLVLGSLAAAVIAYRRDWLAHGFDALLTLPLGTSAVIIGFGFLISLGSLPIDLRVSPLLIPIAHTLVALPFVIRATTPVMRAVDHRLREAAAVLGASPAQAWRLVDLPIVGRALLIGAGFAFAVSLGEFGATLFIVRPDTPTMPVAIFRLLSQPGSLAFGQAMAMATLLMLLTAVAVMLFDRVRSPASAGL